MKISLLYWAGCPSHPEARALLDDVLADLGLSTRVEMHEVTTQEEAERLAFPGSPTILIDGRDIDPVGAKGRAMLACRIYGLPDGRVSPVPPASYWRPHCDEHSTNPSPEFELPGVDGRSHSLDEYAAAPALVLVQYCNHCPYVQAWEQRVNAVQADYAAAGVRLVAISSNDAETYPEDSFDEMQARVDRGPDVRLSLRRRPAPGESARLLAYARGLRVRRRAALVYHGAVDDSRDEDAVTKHYLRDALDAVLEGRSPVVAETPARGVHREVAPLIPAQVRDPLPRIPHARTP